MGLETTQTLDTFVILQPDFTIAGNKNKFFNNLLHSVNHTENES